MSDQENDQKADKPDGKLAEDKPKGLAPKERGRTFGSSGAERQK